MSFQLVLTASVHPNGMFVKVADSKVRQQQYLLSMRTLLEMDSPLVDAITLIENSGADLEPFRRLIIEHNPHHKKVELISLDLNDFPRELGIGYGEFRCLDKGISESVLVTPQTYFVKLTGRLIVRNLASILGNLPAEFDMAADIHPGRPDASKGIVDSRLVIISRDFYMRKIMGLYHKVNGFKGICAEHCLYDVVRETSGGKFVARLPREPQWIGFSGSTGMRYDSLKMRLKYPPKVVVRALYRMMNMPNLKPLWAPSGDKAAAGTQSGMTT